MPTGISSPRASSMKIFRIALTALLFAASSCSRGTRAPASAAPAATPSAAPAAAPARPAQRNDAGLKSGLPEGYVGRTDDSLRRVAEIRHRKLGDRVEIVTGPSHVLYQPGDTLRGTYIVATTFHQMEGPAHPEAFGLFVGGTDLDTPAQRYTYFMVRGTGEYLVKVRDGRQSRDVIGWTAHPAVQKQTADGTGQYRLTIRVGVDSVRFLSSGTQVAAVPRAAVPVDGIFGLRVNHNLRVRFDQLRRSGT